MTTTSKAWQRYQELYFEFAELELTLDLCDMPISEDFWDKMDPLFSKAALAMAQLEAGAIANPDENRMVGHYWLRTPEVAPTAEIQTEIRDTLVEVRRFADGVHSGRIMGADGPFSQILLIGIGGSALGPQCVSKALGHPQHDRLRLYCLDNTDPDGISRVLASIASDLGRTLTIVISKSGATKETRNGMVEARAAYRRADLSFERHAVAVTQKGSALDLQAADEHWLARFPMWDWVGGRTSELSAVGLLPAALQGFDIDSMLSGARACDAATRERVLKRNPSGLLAAMWYLATDGRGAKDMVILPYKDRLEAFPRYLQQLIMESLGKEKDLAGRVVHQGITVYGNKGSTDQHAYVQQLREGIDNFWVTFIEVLEAQKNVPIMVEADVSSGDFLFGFLLGTRQALQEKGRASMTVSVRRMDAFALGVLIALYERAVGFYASMVNINAYHQPGVEAGKRAAGEVIQLRTKVLGHLRSSGDFMTVEQIAAAIGAADRLATVHQICVYLSANAHHRVERQAGRSLVEHKYRSW